MKRFYALSFALLSVVISTGQIQQKLESQVPAQPKYDESIVDEIFGIELYEPLNFLLRADSVRNCSGYLCEGWIEDHYTNGTLLHRGFYVEGQLRTYKNYYPDGTLERDFAMLDNIRCQVRLYYPNGNLKSVVKYNDGVAQEWTDYYQNGNMKYIEKYHRSLTFYLEKKSFYESGSTEDELVLLSKKKLSYDKNEYHENGKIRVDGSMIFNERSYDYTKTGVWTFYDSSGNKTKELRYSDGTVASEKNF